VYSFFGKKVKNRVKLSALSYAYKFDSFLNSPHRIKVVTGGGVFRNKKLQLGSVLQFSKSKSNYGEGNLN
jgi:hypothetical protein